VILFSDLKGSSALYQRIGDEAAYLLMRRHFTLLTQAIRDHQGNVVKTIGDAVMAAFPLGHQAVAAGLTIQQRVRSCNRLQSRGNDMVIRLGLHAGPAIAVNLQGRQDYFGAVVNIAAHLRAASQGDDLVLSATLAADPQVAALLRGHPVTTGTIQLKGLAQPQAFCRIQA
jgi:class 3 adenylate cyclase